MAMDVNNFNTQIYKEEYFWLVIIGIIIASFMFIGSVVPGIIGALLAIGSPVFIQYVLPRVRSYFESDEPIIAAETDNPYQVELGTLEKNGKSILSGLENLNHMFVIGMTRYGKTRLILALITEFIEKFSEDEVKLAFSDAKAVSFNVFGRSKHLFAPIAKSTEETESLIEIALTEMHRRLNLFSDYHERICTNIDEYYELSGERLPRIIIIFDEVADSVDKDSVAEKNLTTLAKMGLAAGIHLVLVTQRPTKMGISHEITSQCQTILCTYMKNGTEYGSVAKIPPKVYQNMRPEKGLFMAFSPDLAPFFLEEYPEYEGWGMLRSRYLDNNVISGIAIVDATTNLELPELQNSIPAWRGSEEDKLTAIEVLESKLGVVTIDDMKKYFGVGRRTGKDWLEKYEKRSFV